MIARKESILVVEDDVRMARMIRKTLEMAGYDIRIVVTAEEALEMLDLWTPDLILLDIMLPGMDGYRFCQKIREFTGIPIVMVTAKGSDEEKLEGFDSGADDYVVKPFSSRELLARIKAIMRRASMSEATCCSPRITIGDLVIDFSRNIASLGGKDLDLTPIEYSILSVLARNAGRLLTPEQIISKVWSDKHTGDTHLLHVSIGRLRQKLDDDPRNPKYIVTRCGIGYMLKTEARSTEQYSTANCIESMS